MLFANGGLLILNLFPHCAHHHLVQSSPHCCDSAGSGRAMIRWHIFMAPTLDPQHMPYTYSTSMVQTQIQNSGWNILVLKIFQVDRHPTACQCSALECLAVYFGAFDRPAWGVLPSWSGTLHTSQPPKNDRHHDVQYHFDAEILLNILFSSI